MATFTERLTEAFRFSGCSQVDLADCLKVHKTVVNSWMKGKSSPNQIEKMIKVAEFFDVNPAWLAGYDAPQNNIKIGKEEEELLAKFCKLNSLGKSKADEYVQDLTEHEKYTRPDDVGAAKTA